MSSKAVHSSAEEFWKEWTPWRHGEPGGGNFADVMLVLRLPETFAAFAGKSMPAAPADHQGRWPVTVIDLGCGAAQMAWRMRDALRAQGAEMERYIGVDMADPDWMVPRLEREFARHGLEDRASYVHHDLQRGLPSEVVDHPVDKGALLLLSCWGITYLPRGPLKDLLTQCVDVVGGWRAPAVLCVNMLTEGQFDRDVLTCRFLTSIVPRQVWLSLRKFRLAYLQQLRLAIKALPQMRSFSVGLRDLISLMAVEDFESLLRELQLEVLTTDRSALWGQTTSLAVPIPKHEGVQESR